MNDEKAEGIESEEDKSDNEDNKVDESAEEEKVQDKNIIAAPFSLLPGTLIFHLHGSPHQSISLLRTGSLFFLKAQETCSRIFYSPLHVRGIL